MTADELKEARRKLGLSVKDAARLFGYSRWYAYESGQREIKERMELSLKYYEMIPKGKRPK